MPNITTNHAITYANLCLLLMMTGVDKCPVSRLINGVDTIKIEDSGNARTPKYYKVLLSLIFFSKVNYYCNSQS